MSEKIPNSNNVIKDVGGKLSNFVISTLSFLCIIASPTTATESSGVHSQSNNQGQVASSTIGPKLPRRPPEVQHPEVKTPEVKHPEVEAPSSSDKHSPANHSPVKAP